MHPNPAFRPAGSTALLEQAAAIGFAHICVAAADGPMVVHAPVTRHGDALRFHVARANRIAPLLDGARLLVSVAGAQGYVSPSWYVRPGDQVPTWNYVAVEVDGTARMLDDAGLIEQLDALAARHEPRVSPDAPWSRDKMDAVALNMMMRAIVGFEVTVTAARGTIKLSQNKPGPDRAGVIAGLRRSGNLALAEAMEAA